MPADAPPCWRGVARRLSPQPMVASPGTGALVASPEQLHAYVQGLTYAGRGPAGAGWGAAPSPMSPGQYGMDSQYGYSPAAFGYAQDQGAPAHRTTPTSTDTTSPCRLCECKAALLPIGLRAAERCRPFRTLTSAGNDWEGRAPGLPGWVACCVSCGCCCHGCPAIGRTAASGALPACGCACRGCGQRRRQRAARRCGSAQVPHVVGESETMQASLIDTGLQCMHAGLNGTTGWLASAVHRAVARSWSWWGCRLLPCRMRPCVDGVLCCAVLCAAA